MTTKQMLELKEGDKVVHKRYGLCLVVSVIPDFGPVILPFSKEGLQLLSRDSGIEATPTIESDYRQNLTISTDAQK
jgi:hypothetical protein